LRDKEPERGFAKRARIFAKSAFNVAWVLTPRHERVEGVKKKTLWLSTGVAAVLLLAHPMTNCATNAAGNEAFGLQGAWGNARFGHGWFANAQGAVRFTEEPGLAWVPGARRWCDGRDRFATVVDNLFRLSDRQKQGRRNTVSSPRPSPPVEERERAARCLHALFGGVQILFTLSPTIDGVDS
ncbi:MAG TPA: hypothetical protein VJA21_14415, partial [Verrucomicrobiae bacterium]